MRVDEHDSIAASDPEAGPNSEQHAEPTTDSALQRWSRRKLASTAPAEPAIPTAPADSAVPAERQAADDETPSAADMEPATADCTVELPDLDSLDEDSDYSAFLSPEVEASVRRVALRKLFGLPCFAVRDGLDDYDDDFGSFEGLGDIVTHEMKRLAAQELARQQQDDGELGDVPANADAMALASEPPTNPEPAASQLADSTAEQAEPAKDSEAAAPQAGSQLTSTTTDHQEPATHA